MHRALLLSPLALAASASALAASASALAAGVGPADLFARAFSSGCSIHGPASCHNTTEPGDACCFEAPGGLLLQTQFWDTTDGPSDSWTIHGLWPDDCDGTYIENCDPSRDYTDIAGLLTSQGASDTLSYMESYWVNINGDNEEFWEHEWATHGTCYNTLQPSCLPSGSPEGAEAVAFFQTVVSLFKTLPTYDWLAAGGITPNRRRKYTASEIVSALTSAAGVAPSLTCEDRGRKLNSVSWYFNLKGSLIDGQFVPVDAPEKGNCASRDIEYLPKSSRDDDVLSVPMTGETQEILN